ncbi:MAG: hypothetical protein Q4F75_05420 [Pseudomonadota bacterium]|nr:hypothetical protein [Pseudomonadota bacterium]
MNINFRFLLFGTTLSLIPSITNAQCAETDCLKLGYTFLQKCDNGLKCPFGEYWACPKVEEKAVLGECTGYAKNCKIADILNSDGTCTSDKVSGKTPIGVVVYVGDDGCGQALALKDLGRTYWSTGLPDIPNLHNYHTLSEAVQDFDSCNNTQKILNTKILSYTFPATLIATSYTPNSAPSTKEKWCLPAAGVAQSMMDNYDKINSSLSKVNGELLRETDDIWYWSSTEYSASYVWAWSYAKGYVGGAWSYFSNTKYSDFYHVRPVLAF